jgi:hypothetical protein
MKREARDAAHHTMRQNNALGQVDTHPNGDDDQISEHESACKEPRHEVDVQWAKVREAED